MASYNLTATLNLQQVDASQAIANLHKQLTATNFVISVKLNTGAAVQAAQQLQQTMKSATSSITGVGQAAQQTATQLRSLASSHTNVSQASRTTTTAVNSVNTAFTNQRREMATAIRDWSTFTSGIISAHFALIKLQQGFAHVKDIQSKQVAYAQTTNEKIGDAGPQRFTKQATEVAQRYGASSTKVMSSGIDLVKAGFEKGEASSLMETMGKASLHSEVGDNLKGVTDAAIMLKTVFHGTATSIESDISRMVRISADFAVEMPTLVESMKKAGGSYSAFGGKDIAGMIGLTTAVGTKTRESGQIIGNMLKSNMSRIYGGNKEASEGLQSLNVSPFTAQGNAREPIKVYTDIANAMAKLTEEEKAHVAQKLAGTHQNARFLALISNMDTAQRAYAVALKSGTELTKAAEIAQDSLGNKLDKLRERWLGVATDIGGNKAFSILTDEAIGLTGALSQLVPSMMAIAAIKGGGLLAGGMAGNGRLAAGIGGVAMAYAGSKASQDSYIGQAANVGAQGASAGLIAFSAGLGGTASLIIGLGVAVGNLSSAMVDAENKIRGQVIGTANTSASSAMETYGLSDGRTTQQINSLLAKTQSEGKDAFRQSGFGESFGRAASNIVGGRWGSLGDVGTQVQKERIGGFQTGIKQVSSTVDSGAQRFVQSGANMKDWESYGNGVMTKLATLYDVIDDGVANQSRNLKAIVAEQIKQRDSQAKLSEETEASAQAAQTEAQYKKEMAERAAQLSQSYSQLVKSAEANKAVGLGKIGIAEQTASFANRPIQTGNAHNELQIQQAKAMGGSSDINTLVTRLTALTEIRSKNIGGTGESVTPIIDSTVGALRALSDSVGRTKGYFDELSQVTQQLNAKYQVSEGWFSSDAKGRKTMTADKEAATKLIAGGGNLNAMKIQDQQAALRHLNRFGDIKGAVTGSQYSGRELKEAVLNRSTGGAFQPELNAKQDIESKILGVMQNANQASVALYNAEANLQSTFFQTLSVENKSFLATLSQIWGVKNVVPEQAQPTALASVQAVPTMTMPLPALTPLGQQNVAGSMSGVGMPIAAANPVQTGVDLQKLAAQSLSNQTGIADSLMPEVAPQPFKPLEGMSWKQLPTQEVENLEDKRTRNRANYVQSQLSRGADPARFSQFSEQLGLQPEGFTNPNLRSTLDMALQMRSKGYDNQEVRALRSSGVDFSTKPPVDDNTQRITDSIQVAQAALSGQGLEQALANSAKHADKWAKATSGEGLIDAANLFGSNITRLQQVLNKEISIAGGPSATSADKPSTSRGADGATDLTGMATLFGNSVTGFNGSVTAFGGYCENFSISIAKFSESIKQIPSSISLTSAHTVDVNIAGGDVLRTIEPSLREMVVATVGREIDNFKVRLRELGPEIS